MSCFWNWFGKKDKETDEVEAIGGESSPVQATPVEAWGAQSDSPRDPTTADVETIQPDSEGKRKSIARQPGRPADCELESIADDFMVETISRACSREVRGKVNTQGSMGVRDWYEEERFELGQEPAAKSGHINWKKGELLGSGAFGKVYLGLNLDTGELLAVKAVPIALDEDDEQTTSLVREISLMKVLFHENIVRYIGTQRDESMLHIFLEYVPGGSISAVLQKFGQLSEDATRAYSKQILHGLAYLHAHQIMHRDIKGANILVSNTGTIKLADFGASKKITEMLTQYDCKSLKGTPYWMAPEVIMQAGHGRSADIWSVGATIVEMLTGKPPYSEFPTQVSVLFHIASTQEPPTLPAHISEECLSLLMLCFQRNPKDRPTAKALLQHPWLTSRVDSSPSITPSSTAIESPKAAKHVLQFGATVGRPTSDSSTTPPVPKMGDSAPDDWFKIPKAAAVKTDHQLLLSNKSEGSDGGMCQLGIASYLTEVLNDNEKQLSGDFKQSLQLLMKKPGRLKRRNPDQSPKNTSGNSSAKASSGAASPMLSSRLDDQPIQSSYARQMQKEQDERMAQSMAAQNAKLKQQQEWEQELQRAKIG